MTDGPADQEGQSVGNYSADIGALPSWNRRRVLSSTLAAGSLAGCLGGGADGPAETAVPTTAAPTMADSSDLKTVDTTDTGDAEFDIGEETYTISATGQLNNGGDLYGAMYADDAFGSGRSVQVTVESQTNTDEWARSGIMVANDITDPGGSVGDVVVAITPEHGVEMRWDSEESGMITTKRAGSSETTYPTTLKLERSGTTFTGYFSTDGGESFTTITSVTIDAAADRQDVGMVASSRSDQRSTVEFSGFELGSAPTPTATPTPREPTDEAHPLPADSEALDRIVFGSGPSERAHDFTAETSAVVEGQNETIARAIEYPEQSNSVGSMSFTVECSSEGPTHLTLKLDANPPAPDQTPGSLFLFHDDEMVGYATEDDDWPTLGMGTRFFGFNRIGFADRMVFLQKADWVFPTMQLPRSITENKDSVELRIVHFHWAYDHEVASHPVYRAYTHTDPLFELPSDEEDTLNRDLGRVDGPDENPTAKLTAKAEELVAQHQDGPRKDAKGIDALSIAYSRDWIDTLDRDAVFETVKNSIDHFVVQQATAESAGEAAGGHGWQFYGLVGFAYVRLAEVFEERGALSEPIADHPQDTTRREAYAEFFREGYDWRLENGRAFITNQTMYIATGLVGAAEALEVLAPDRAPPEEEVDRILDEGFGIEPMSTISQSNNYDAGAWHPVSKKGLNCEKRYSAGHGRSVWIQPHMLARSTTDEDRAARLKERLADTMEAMGEFRWRGQHAGPNDDQQYFAQEAYLGSRGGTHVGRTGRFWSFPGVAELLGEEAEVAKRWGELELELGLQDAGISSQVLRILPRIIWQKEGIEAVQEMSPSEHDLPWERERSVWGDHTQGMVSIVDGDVRLMASLGHNEGTHISNTALFDYAGPRSDRVGVTELRRKEFPQFTTAGRPNNLKDVTGNRGAPSSLWLPWTESSQGIDQYLRGESLSLASRPDGNPWPGQTENSLRGHPLKGFIYHYREVDIGPYRIGVNSTGAEQYGFAPAEVFQMPVPDGTVVDLETGEEVESNFVNVEPETTRVLKVE